MNRKEILDTAIKCVCGEREQDYGTPENNFSLIANLWSAYHGGTFTAKDVAIMMCLLKVARIKTGSSEDSFVDLAGYAACAGEIETKRLERVKEFCNRSCNTAGARSFVAKNGDIPEGMKSYE